MKVRGSAKKQAATKDDACEPSRRRMRSDATQNRARLIAAAHDVFAERGLAATLDDVARHAGVGVATAYRHFPNKRALASEVLEGAMAQLAAYAEAAADVADPWEAFAGFFQSVVALQSQHRGLHHLSASEGIVSPEGRRRFETGVAALFDRARRAGAIRADAGPTDIGTVLIMLRTVIDLSPPTRPDLWRRWLAFLLDGLRATDRPSSPVGALTADEFEQFVAAKNRSVK